MPEKAHLIRLMLATSGVVRLACVLALWLLLAQCYARAQVNPSGTTPNATPSPREFPPRERTDPRNGMGQPSRQGTPQQDVSLAKAAAHQEFNKNFRELQESSQALRHEHEAGHLAPGQLAKHLKSIQKCAKNLRRLMQLGVLEHRPEINGSPQSPQAFDQFIQRLTRTIQTFVHSPVHQNNKVFDMGASSRARVDLEMIIELSKVIERQAHRYTPLLAQTGVRQ